MEVEQRSAQVGTESVTPGTDDFLRAFCVDVAGTKHKFTFDQCFGCVLQQSSPAASEIK